MSLVVTYALLSTLAGSASGVPGGALSALANDSEGLQCSGLRLRRVEVAPQGPRSSIEPTVKLQSNEDGALPFALWVGARFHGARGSALDVHFDLAHLAASGLKKTPAGRVALSAVGWARRGHGLVAPFVGPLSQRWRSALSAQRVDVLAFDVLAWRAGLFRRPFFARHPMAQWPGHDVVRFDIRIRADMHDAVFLALLAFETPPRAPVDVGRRGCRLVR